MSDDKKPTTTAAAKKPEPQQPAPPKVASEPKTITVETTGDFQLYDVTTQTLFPAGEKVERPANDRFVETNIRRGKLKKA